MTAVATTATAFDFEGGTSGPTTLTPVAPTAAGNCLPLAIVGPDTMPPALMKVGPVGTGPVGDAWLANIAD